MALNRESMVLLKSRIKGTTNGESLFRLSQCDRNVSTPFHSQNVLKIRDVRLRCVGDQVPCMHIARSFVYRNDRAVCLRQITGRRTTHANCLSLSESTVSKD